MEGDMDKTLIIASIDFSHFVTEETALANDQRTMKWFESWGNGDVSDPSLDSLLNCSNISEKSFVDNAGSGKLSPHIRLKSD